MPKTSKKPQLDSYHFFYEGGAEGGLSSIIIKESSREIAMVGWDAFANQTPTLTLKLTVVNLKADAIIYQR